MSVGVQSSGLSTYFTDLLSPLQRLPIQLTLFCIIGAVTLIADWLVTSHVAVSLLVLPLVGVSTGLCRGWACQGLSVSCLGKCLLGRAAWGMGRVVLAHELSLITGTVSLYGNPTPPPQTHSINLLNQVSPPPPNPLLKPPPTAVHIRKKPSLPDITPLSGPHGRALVVQTLEVHDNLDPTMAGPTAVPQGCLDFV